MTENEISDPVFEAQMLTYLRLRGLMPPVIFRIRLSPASVRTNGQPMNHLQPFGPILAAGILLGAISPTTTGETNDPPRSRD